MRFHLTLLFLILLLPVFVSCCAKAESITSLSIEPEIKAPLIVEQQVESDSAPAITQEGFKPNGWTANGLLGHVRYLKETMPELYDEQIEGGKFEPPSQIRETYFDADGNIVTFIQCVKLPIPPQQDNSISKENQLVLYSGCQKGEFSYDLAKKMMTVTRFIKELGKTAYESDGQAITTYFEDGKVKDYLVYNRDGKLNAKDITKKMANGRMMTEMYSDDNLIQRTISYSDAQGNRINEISSWMGENAPNQGFKSKTVTKFKNNLPISEETFQDDKDLITGFEKYSADGRFVIEGKCNCYDYSEYRIEYEFDQNQNATKIVKQALVTKSGKTHYQPVEITTREIVYYK